LLLENSGPSRPVPRDGSGAKDPLGKRKMESDAEAGARPKTVNGQSFDPANSPDLKRHVRSLIPAVNRPFRTKAPANCRGLVDNSTRSLRNTYIGLEYAVSIKETLGLSTG
jgi:hypothetical protein